jgi:hypothetical protein
MAVLNRKEKFPDIRRVRCYNGEINAEVREKTETLLFDFLPEGTLNLTDKTLMKKIKSLFPRLF